MGARRGAAIPPSSESFVSGHRDHTEGLGSWLCGLSEDNNTVRFLFFFLKNRLSSMTQKEVDEISAKAIKQTPTELRATLECPSGNGDIL